MNELINKIALCVERGKVNIRSPYPPDMKGEEGADELTKRAIDEGLDPQDILNEGLIKGMYNIGMKFKENKVFVPEVLIAAKAMNTAMVHIQPFLFRTK
jgi:methanogenic corrinoid protein MtbC1